MSIILAVLEVDSASICGSVPVFWPVLSQQLGKIFVTKEFIVTIDNRLDHVDDGCNSRRSSSSNDLELGLKEKSGGLMEKPSNKSHYDDVFIQSQVDPLARTGHVAVQSSPDKLARMLSKSYGIGCVVAVIVCIFESEFL